MGLKGERRKKEDQIVERTGQSRREEEENGRRLRKNPGQQEAKRTDVKSEGSALSDEWTWPEREK